MRERVTRVTGVIRKETVGVLRQPRLLVTLVLGPFLILLVFGLGLSDSRPQFSVVFVAPEGSTAARTVERYADELASYIQYRGVVTDEATARQRLLDGEVDIVAVLPEDPLAELRQDHRAVIDVYHHALDPIVAAAIEAAARLAADEINRQIVAGIVAEGQTASQILDQALPPVEIGLTEVRRRLEAGEVSEADARLEEMEDVLERVGDDAGDTLTLVEETREAGRAAERTVSSGSELRRAIARLLEPPATATPESRLAQLAVVEGALADLRAELEVLRGVRPDVLIRPFRAVTTGLDRQVTSALGFYAPSIVMLLVQHLGVTFSALSLVRERQLGTVELFAVAPVSTGEILLGKCVGYLLLGGAVVVVLAPSIQLLDVTFAGAAVPLIAAMFLVLLASLGIGFLISLVSASDSLAIQLAMLSLLASFFFSGFFLPLDQLGGPAAVVGALLPATHGITIAREVVLRGNEVPLGDVAQLLAISAVTLGVTWHGFARQLRLA